MNEIYLSQKMLSDENKKKQKIIAENSASEIFDNATKLNNKLPIHKQDTVPNYEYENKSPDKIKYLSEKYYYRRRIGGGTFGEVWEVYNYDDKKIYAAKDEIIKNFPKKKMCIETIKCTRDLSKNIIYDTIKENDKKVNYFEYHDVKKEKYSRIYDKNNNEENVSCNIGKGCFDNTEKEKSMPSMIEKESKIYLDLEGRGFGKGLPKYYGLITTTIKKVMIMERLGCSLDELYKKQGKTFSNKQLCFYGMQMINLLEKLHSFGYLHRDVKPQNFIFGYNDFSQLYICDFGLAKKYIKNGEHIPEENNKKLIGTMRYTSVYIHDGIEPSRRDDIISVLYIIIHSKYKYLPWQSKTNRKLNKKEIGNIKKNTPINILCGELKEISHAMNHCYSLKFHQKPDYDYIKLKIQNQFF